jgi:hypothetical protein
MSVNEIINTDPSTNIQLNVLHVRKYPHIYNWESLCKELDLSEDFIREFNKYIHWINVSWYQKLSEKFIREFKNNVNWDCIVKRQVLSEDFIREFKDEVNWIDISGRQILSESFIREFKEKLDWNQISYFQDLSEDFIREFIYNLSLNNICIRRYNQEYGNETLFSITFIRDYKNQFGKLIWDRILLAHCFKSDLIIEFKDYLNWNLLSKHFMFHEDFIEKYEDYFNWKKVSQYQIRISEDFIRKHREKIDFNLLEKNKMRNLIKYYSIGFIKEFAPLFNQHYKYNMYSNRIQSWWKKIIYKPNNSGYKRSFDEFNQYNQYIKFIEKSSKL